MMNRDWKTTLQVTQQETKLLVTGPEGDMLKARLNSHPNHPRALLTLLEGVSLWRGEPLCVALRVGGDFRHGQGSILFGDELWPGESLLVRFEIACQDRRRGRLSGVGDFRALRGWA